MDKFGWFFFQLLVLGSVEDFKSGCAFQLHKNVKWEVYIEVSSGFVGWRYVCVYACTCVCVCVCCGLLRRMGEREEGRRREEKES